VRIIEAREADRDVVVALWHDAGLTRPWNDADADFMRALASPASTVLVAVDGDTICGSVMVGDDGHRGWLYYLAVRTDLRHRGTGRALVHAAEAWLAHRGVAAVRLMVRNENTAVVAFYEALGYEDKDCIVLGRDL